MLEREGHWGNMPLGIMEKTDIAGATLPREADTSLIYKCCLLAYDVKICNLVLEVHLCLNT